MAMARSNQGGSILSFVIIGGILTALLVGGVYLVQRQTAADVATQPETTQPADDTNGAEQDAANNNDNEQAPTQPEPKSEPAPAPKDEATPPKEDDKAAQPTAPSTPSSEDKKHQDDDKVGVTPPANKEDSSVAALPQTGPAETISAVLGLSFLSGASIAYVRSRR